MKAYDLKQPVKELVLQVINTSYNTGAASREDFPRAYDEYQKAESALAEFLSKWLPPAAYLKEKENVRAEV